MKQTTVLCILDGWGCAEAHQDNAITRAMTPTWTRILAEFPHGQLDASGGSVGLPYGQMGNSEVGHMTIGAGRTVFQDLPRIDQVIAQDQLGQQETLMQFIQKTQIGTGVCHLWGLLSDGGVHSHITHIIALARLFAQNDVTVYLHLQLDGRDTSPQSGYGYTQDLLKAFQDFPNVSLATLGGRYFGMDRDKRWDRLEKSYEAIVEGQGPQFQDPLTYIQESYQQGVTDEFVVPGVMQGFPGIQTGDSFFIANFRADRVRQLLQALTDKNFGHFTTQALRLAPIDAIGGMADYGQQFEGQVTVVFPPQAITHHLGELLAAQGKTQLRLAETEKYAHVTFFFNGGSDEILPGEDRVLIPSPKVATYDLQPEMSAPEVTKILVEAIKSGTYDFIVVNYANADMVGHTGDMSAAIKAVETIDRALTQVLEAVLEADGNLLITADHGNIEHMHDEVNNMPHTAHTTNLVPFVLCSKEAGQYKIAPMGTLGDVAPTVLALMGIHQPVEMTGHSLLLAHDAGLSAQRS